MVLGIEFNTHVLGPGLVAGVAAAGLYGLVAVALVLSYRISRTVAFLHGGLLVGGTLLYWWLVHPEYQASADELILGASEAQSARPGLAPWLGLLIVAGLGALIGAGYGLVVMGPLGDYPRVMVTTFSLAAMLIIIGGLFSTLDPQSERVASAFGTGTVKIFDQVLTSHQVVTLAFLGGIVAAVALVLKRTRFGVYARAIADNSAASRLVGVPTLMVGTAMYALSGAVATFGGALLASSMGADSISVLFIFQRALLVAVIGAFSSVSLALVGALLLAVMDNLLRAGFFGIFSGGVRESVIVATIFGVVVLMDRFGSKGRDIVEAEAL